MVVAGETHPRDRHEAAEVTVQAAGGVVWQGEPPDIEVLVVHRPRYDDWSLPKGKLEPGESFAQAARREVHEETGYVVELGRELPSTSYRDGHGRPKVVRYWAMTPQANDAFVANHEVDELRWLPVAEAAQLLSYDHDAVVVDALVRALVGL